MARQTTSKSSTTRVKYNGIPSKFDAVLGRGGEKNCLRKDSLFRELIIAHWSDYCAIPNHRSQEKRDFAHERVINPIIENGGHFLVYSGKEPFELLPANKRELVELYSKISQCFRDEKKKNNNVSHKVLNKRLATHKSLRAASPPLELPQLEGTSSRASISSRDLTAQATAESNSDGSTTREEESDLESIFSADSEPLPIDFNYCQSAPQALEDFWGIMTGRNIFDLCKEDKEAAAMPPPSLSCQTSLIFYAEGIMPPPPFTCETSLGWFGHDEDFRPLDESFVSV
jgi:hypothetical protein